MKASAYRPISVSSYVGKLLEKILEKRIRIHCEIEGVLDEEQEGFRAQRNTSRYHRHLNGLEKTLKGPPSLPKKDRVVLTCFITRVWYCYISPPFYFNISSVFLRFSMEENILQQRIGISHAQMLRWLDAHMVRWSDAQMLRCLHGPGWKIQNNCKKWNKILQKIQRMDITL